MPDKDEIITAAVNKYVDSKGGLEFYAERVDIKKSYLTKSGEAVLISRHTGKTLSRYSINELGLTDNPEELKSAWIDQSTKATGLTDILFWMRRHYVAVIAVLAGTVLCWASVGQLIRINEENTIKRLAKADLKDPGSARFGRIYINKDVEVMNFSDDILADPETAVAKMIEAEKTGNLKRRRVQRACVSVNAKNSFGGYVGEKIFHFQKDRPGDEWRIIDYDGTSDCETFTGAR